MIFFPGQFTILVKPGFFGEFSVVLNVARAHSLGGSLVYNATFCSTSMEHITYIMHNISNIPDWNMFWSRFQQTLTFHGREDHSEQCKIHKVCFIEGCIPGLRHCERHRQGAIRSLGETAELARGKRGRNLSARNPTPIVYAWEPAGVIRFGPHCSEKYSNQENSQSMSSWSLLCYICISVWLTELIILARPYWLGLHVLWYLHSTHCELVTFLYIFTT